MSVRRELSNTASEQDEQQYHFFGAEKEELSENSVIPVLKKAKHPFKYRLTPQYLKETAKVQ